MNNTIKIGKTGPYDTVSIGPTSTLENMFITDKADIQGLPLKYSGQFKYPIEPLRGIQYITSVYIKEVIYNDPATIILWSDGTKTVSKCANGDNYSPETGLVICVLKKLSGGAAIHDLLKDWIPTQGNRVTLKQVRKKYKK